MGFLIRWAFAFALLAATFNPTRWNYSRWASENYQTETPMTFLFGLLLLICYIIYLRATLRSIGPVGMSLVLAVIGALLWVLYDKGLLTLNNSNLNIWIGLLALSVVLGIGLSWSHVRRALSGQADMDDLDD